MPVVHNLVPHATETSLMKEDMWNDNEEIRFLIPQKAIRYTIESETTPPEHMTRLPLRSRTRDRTPESI